MNNYDKIETIGHIKRIDVLGTDPLTGNIVIELYCGSQKTDQLKRFGAFSISQNELKLFLLQAGDELNEHAAVKTHNA